MKYDVFKYVQKIPETRFRNKVMDQLINWIMPFHKGLKLQVEAVSPERVVVVSTPVKRRLNHVGSVHACFIALMGEFAAGLCLAQTYSMADYRMIIGNLKINYVKQGHGKLKSTAHKPKEITQESADEFWITMHSEITNEKNEVIANCETSWQFKTWDKVRKKL